MAWWHAEMHWRASMVVFSLVKWGPWSFLVVFNCKGNGALILAKSVVWWWDAMRWSFSVVRWGRGRRPILWAVIWTTMWWAGRSFFWAVVRTMSTGWTTRGLPMM